MAEPEFARNEDEEVARHAAIMIVGLSKDPRILRFPAFVRDVSGAFLDSADWGIKIAISRRDILAQDMTRLIGDDLAFYVNKANSEAMDIANAEYLDRFNSRIHRDVLAPIVAQKNTADYHERVYQEMIMRAPTSQLGQVKPF